MSASFVSGAFLLLLLFLVDKLQIDISQSFIVIEWSKMILIYTIPLLALKTNIVYVNNDIKRKGVINLRRVLVVVTTLVYLFVLFSGDLTNRKIIEILLFSKLIDIIIEEKYLMTASRGMVLKGYFFALFGNLARILAIFSLIYIECNESLILILIFTTIGAYFTNIKFSYIAQVDKSILLSLLLIICTTYMSAYMINILRVNLSNFESRFIDDFAVLMSLGGVFGLVYNVVWQRSYFKGTLDIIRLLKEIVFFSLFLVAGSLVLGPVILRTIFSFEIDDFAIIKVLTLMILFSFGHVLLNLYKIRKKVLYELCSYFAASIFTHLLIVKFDSFMTVLTFSSLFVFVLGVFSFLYEKSRVHIY